MFETANGPDTSLLQGAVAIGKVIDLGPKHRVSAMSTLPEIWSAATKFGQAASFDPGSRYADYDPGTDTKAGYGIAGMVAAGVGVVAAK